MNERTRLITKAQGILEDAKAEGRDLTPTELAEVNACVEQVEAIDTARKSAKHARTEELVGQIAALGAGTAKAAGSEWAKSVAERMGTAAAGRGVKALLTGEVQTPPAVAVVALPDVPRGLVDLVPRAELTENSYSYLRQVAKDIQAAPVADGAVKPTSTLTWEEVEGRARVIAHLSEPFPIRYADDYRSMMEVLDQQMLTGIVQAIEEQIVSGTGTGEDFTGILSAAGVTSVAYAGDLITTLRRARTELEAKGEPVTGVVLNPTDLEALDMIREGATGGFLMDSGAYDRIFGQGVKPVASLAVPAGTAIMGDWRTTRLRVRQSAHTLAATQAGDLFDRNLMKLRTEGRFAFDLLRPQAMAVVDLTAA